MRSVSPQVTILLIILIIKSWRLANATAQAQLPEKTSSYESYSNDNLNSSVYFSSVLIISSRLISLPTNS